jgi:hypothetical protein
LQRVDLGYHFLYFKYVRADKHEIARAILANERFILDGFNAEGAFHLLSDSKPPTITRRKPGLYPLKLKPKLFALVREFSVFGTKRNGDDNVAVTVRANPGVQMIFRDTKGTNVFISARHGSTFNSKTELRIRPSVSEISIRK